MLNNRNYWWDCCPNKGSIRISALMLTFSNSTNPLPASGLFAYLKATGRRWRRPHLLASPVIFFLNAGILIAVEVDEWGNPIMHADAGFEGFS